MKNQLKMILDLMAHWTKLSYCSYRCQAMYHDLLTIHYHWKLLTLWDLLLHAFYTGLAWLETFFYEIDDNRLHYYDKLILFMLRFCTIVTLLDRWEILIKRYLMLWIINYNVFYLLLISNSPTNSNNYLNFWTTMQMARYRLIVFLVWETSSGLMRLGYYYYSYNLF